jgi:hypothetical protein
LLLHDAAGKIHLRLPELTTQSLCRVSPSEVAVNLMIVLSGLALLVGLAIAVGVADTHARDAAWRRIAAARRDQQERERVLRRYVERSRCPHCPVDQHFGRR